MARDQPQINIRVPAYLRAKLEASRAVTGRSLTSEIVARLEQSFSFPTRADEALRVAVEYVQAEKAYEDRKEWLKRLRATIKEEIDRGTLSEQNQRGLKVFEEELEYLRSAVGDLRRRFHDEAGIGQGLTTGPDPQID